MASAALLDIQPLAVATTWPCFRLSDYLARQRLSTQRHQASAPRAWLEYSCRLGMLTSALLPHALPVCSWWSICQLTCHPLLQYYHSPGGKKFRSRTEAAKALGLSPPPSGRGKAASGPSAPASGTQHAALLQPVGWRGYAAIGAWLKLTSSSMPHCRSRHITASPALDLGCRCSGLVPSAIWLPYA